MRFRFCIVSVFRTYERGDGFYETDPEGSIFIYPACDDGVSRVRLWVWHCFEGGRLWRASCLRHESFHLCGVDAIRGSRAAHPEVVRFKSHLRNHWKTVQILDFIEVCTVLLLKRIVRLYPCFTLKNRKEISQKLVKNHAHKARAVPRLNRLGGRLFYCFV